MVCARNDRRNFQKVSRPKTSADDRKYRTAERALKYSFFGILAHSTDLHIRTTPDLQRHPTNAQRGKLSKRVTSGSYRKSNHTSKHWRRHSQANINAEISHHRINYVQINPIMAHQKFSPRRETLTWTKSAKRSIIDHTYTVPQQHHKQM